MRQHKEKQERPAASYGKEKQACSLRLLLFLIP